ncbi:hypothetical protein [Clostridium sp. VAP41]|uniref:hypothetical protein n=1 Tax=Clostridium sp. VAP41 TaxID=2949979 RepID=UPI002079830F|nr:hypothetical protein [Clostridium sp. VAP41]
MDIEKLRKEMTREEFLKYERENNEQCPSDFGLKDIYCSEKDCIFNFECEKCWEKSVENIKFKDDMEDKKLSKELNVLQAIEMPIGTEFEVIDKYGDKNLVNIILCENNNLCRQSERLLCWKNSYKELGSGNYELTLKFIPIQHPVSFIEAINSGKKIKCVHSRFSKSDIYMSIIKMFEMMSNSSCRDFIPTLINEGKWYVEEDNAND